MKTFLIFISLFLIANDKENKIEKEIIIIKNMQENFSQISVKDFKKEMQNNEKILIDVRTPWELDIYWKIRENQILININDKSFESKIQKLDKSKKYLIYCWHGNRSVVAREYMKSLDFVYVKDLEWGIDLWEIMWEKIIK